MKRLTILCAGFLAVVLAVPAHAHGAGRGGWHGGHGGYGHRGAWSNNWVGPVLGAAIVGSAIYAASTPSYAMPQQVVVQQQYLPPHAIG